VTFAGEHLRYEGVAFSAGTELRPLAPVQHSPPIWVVSNPGIAGGEASGDMRDRIARAARRVVRLGDGWMTCCRARHPEELEDQLGMIRAAAAEEGRNLEGFDVAYQVTMNIGASAKAARDDFGRYIASYYPEFGGRVDLSDWGPVGAPEDIRAWLERFAQAGVTHFICRFASSVQEEQVRRFAEEVLPAFADRRIATGR
jgi:alkanesulfonate monooxygenase SsuD/methylene tetrahydromethanopterin reductase-like flavin-dependent oxidoreductase (luciferase family)